MFRFLRPMVAPHKPIAVNPSFEEKTHPSQVLVVGQVVSAIKRTDVSGVKAEECLEVAFPWESEVVHAKSDLHGRFVVAVVAVQEEFDHPRVCACLRVERHSHRDPERLGCERLNGDGYGWQKCVRP